MKRIGAAEPPPDPVVPPRPLRQSTALVRTNRVAGKYKSGSWAKRTCKRRVPCNCCQRAWKLAPPPTRPKRSARRGSGAQSTAGHLVSTAATSAAISELQLRRWSRRNARKAESKASYQAVIQCPETPAGFRRIPASNTTSRSMVSSAATHHSNRCNLASASLSRWTSAARVRNMSSGLTDVRVRPPAPSPSSSDHCGGDRKGGGDAGGAD
mmetsp:Transcript_63571/g.182571  ORF Transcript_63571/g.182571 Transcript_63571/m.182571 type:complete len:211 (+) Transcript_63571:1686-2318(+)